MGKNRELYGMIKLSDLRFGDIDAKNEALAQDRENSYVLLNSFIEPPTISIEKLQSGSKFLIAGPKGSGKTALIIKLRSIKSNNGSKTKIVLFKSDFDESSRSRLAVYDFMKSEIFTKQSNIIDQHDYKSNWRWYCLRCVVSLLADDDILDGKDVVSDLRIAFGLDEPLSDSFFSGMQFSKIRAQIEARLKVPQFSSKIKVDLDALKKSGAVSADEFIELCEERLSLIKFLPGKSISVFFDELEVFFQTEDQKVRDFALIRDLIFVVTQMNRRLSTRKIPVTLYASLRSEILMEVNRIGPELRRDVEDCGVTISWETKISQGTHPLLQIVEQKIKNSIIELSGIEPKDIWQEFFPPRIFGKMSKQYFLDISMFRPRTIVQLLLAAQKHDPQAGSFSIESFQNTTQRFSESVLTEIEEDLLVSYSPSQVQIIFKCLTGFTPEFYLDRFVSRLHTIEQSLIEQQSGKNYKRTPR